MIKPLELTEEYPMEVGLGMMSDTIQVWETLGAAATGDLQKMRQLVTECRGLAYAQYVYAPPIHFAVREGHEEMVRYLLGLGAHDPAYRTYHYRDSLQTFARDRGLEAIADMLDEYATDAANQQFSGDNGTIHIPFTQQELDFEQAVNDRQYAAVEAMLAQSPGILHKPAFFWGEGILAVPTNRNDKEMVQLLFAHGARVPQLLKWTHAYYFKHLDMAEIMMANGMSPDTHNWHATTILHDMAQKGDIPKAELLLRYGASINRVDAQYRSTPLGIAARFGQTEMVRFLLDNNADPILAGADWARPLVWAEKKGHEGIVELLRKV